jgi:hypothetical protein
MGKYKKNPKHNVISIRVTDKELEALARESHTTNRSISDLMREALHKIVPSSTSCYDSYNKGGITV